MGLFNFTRKNPNGSHAGLILDRTQRPISHLYGLLYRLNFYYSKRILPIFCFDGKISELKRIITKDQLKDFIFSEKWYQEAMKNGNKLLGQQIALSKEYMWQNIIKESKNLLGMLGVPYIESPASAESQCAYLVKQGFANFTNSQDYDALLFGSPFIIQNLSKSLKRKIKGKWQYQKIQPMKIDLQKNLLNLNITVFQLVDIAILVGTDYFPGVANIGTKKALSLVRKYQTIENIISNQKNNYDFTGLTQKLIRKIRSLFIFPDVNENVEDLIWNVPNISGAELLMCENHFLNKERVVKNLELLYRNFLKCKNFFNLQIKAPKKRQLSLKEF
jgi:flap endonuclease-1